PDDRFVYSEHTHQPFDEFAHGDNIGTAYLDRRFEGRFRAQASLQRPDQIAYEDRLNPVDSAIDKRHYITSTDDFTVAADQFAVAPSRLPSDNERRTQDDVLQSGSANKLLGLPLGLMVAAGGTRSSAEGRHHDYPLNTVALTVLHQLSGKAFMKKV